MAEQEHADCVAAWLDRTPRDLSPEGRIGAFEQAFGALWQRASLTLGEVTLTAITSRVLHDASERFGVLATLEINASGIHWQEMRARAGSLHGDEIKEASRLVLVEFLTVLGNLTAEILTPALHAELSSVALGDASEAPDERAARANDDDEGAAS